MHMYLPAELNVETQRCLYCDSLVWQNGSVNNGTFVVEGNRAICHISKILLKINESNPLIPYKQRAYTIREQILFVNRWDLVHQASKTSPAQLTACRFLPPSI